MKTYVYDEQDRETPIMECDLPPLKPRNVVCDGKGKFWVVNTMWISLYKQKLYCSDVTGAPDESF